MDGHLLPGSSHSLASICVCVQISSFYKDTSHIELKPILMTPISLKSLSWLHSEELGVRARTYVILGGHISARDTIYVMTNLADIRKQRCMLWGKEEQQLESEGEGISQPLHPRENKTLISFVENCSLWLGNLLNSHFNFTEREWCKEFLQKR